MTRDRVIATNAALLKHLGLDHLPHVTALRIECANADTLPIVTVDMHATVPPGDALQPLRRRFELVAIEDDEAPPSPPPFDLDAMCVAARRRVHDTIERAYVHHRRMLRRPLDEYTRYSPPGKSRFRVYSMGTNQYEVPV